MRWRNGEGDGFAFGVEHQEQIGHDWAGNQARQRLLARVGPIQVHSRRIEPADLLVGVESFPPQHRMRPAKRQHAAGKLKDFAVPLQR